MTFPTTSEFPSKREPIGEAPPVEIIGHRGASFDAPENTLAAIRLAWNQGADAVEIDVHASRDGRIIVGHDPTTGRLGGVDLAIADHDSAELRTVDVGRWKGSEFEGERLPFLEDVLSTIPLGKRLLIEIKCGAFVVDPLKRLLDASGRLDQEVAIIGFDHEVVAAAKRAMPARKSYLVADVRPVGSAGDRLATVDALIAQALAIHADGLDLSAVEELDRTTVQRITRNGLELHVWTVNDPEFARRLTEAGVQGITTDRPGLIRRWLELRG